MRHSYGFRRKRALSPHTFLVAVAVFTGLGLLMLTLRSMDPPQTDTGFVSKVEDEKSVARPPPALNDTVGAGIHGGKGRGKTCSTVEEMGESFKGSEMVWKESMRVRNIIRQHFALNGASRIRELPPEQFCKHGFVLGKASEAGFGNEMYKILNAGALSVMLNRSLIIGQTRHIDDSRFQNTTDALACQFFLKNVHSAMRKSASDLFGEPELLHSRPNVFGELMKFLIAPSEDVEEAVKWVLGGGADPDISLHMRMLMNRPVRAVHAAVNCVKNAMHSLHHPRPKVVLVSDTPAFVKSTLPEISKFAEVLHFDYQKYQGNISGGDNKLHSLDFRVKDWGPAPRWVAFVDFFLASRAKHAVVTGAHRRVGTTYAQLIAALAAANSLGQSSTEFAFLSTFQSNLLSDGLRLQVGWGHVWNRFAGPLSCPNQRNQCAYTPLLPPAWWDGLWQSPIPRDIRRLEVFGIKLSALGTIDERHLESFCSTKKNTVNTLLLV